MNSSLYTMVSVRRPVHEHLKKTAHARGVSQGRLIEAMLRVWDDTIDTAKAHAVYNLTPLKYGSGVNRKEQAKPNKAIPVKPPTQYTAGPDPWAKAERRQP